MGIGHNKMKNSTVEWEGAQYNKEIYSTVARGQNTIKESTLQWGGDTIQ